MEYDAVKITGGSLLGSIAAPKSKSYAHRMLISAFLCGGSVKIANCSDDVTATLNILKSFCETVTDINGKVRFGKIKENIKDLTLNCRESGTSLRLLLPLSAALGVDNVTFYGTGRLPLRPISELTGLLRSGGVTVSADRLPITVSGKLKSGDYTLPGNVSSQYISGMLFALSTIKGDSTLTLSSPLLSKPYVDMTVDVLRSIGADIVNTENGYTVHGGKPFVKKALTVEGDWSNAAFFLAAGAVGGKITVTGLNSNSLQGDREIINILRRFGADVSETENSVTVKRNKLQGITVDCTDTPDLVPIIAVLAAFAVGKTEITGSERLRLKESDRVTETVNRLNRLGIKTKDEKDKITVIGGTPIPQSLTAADDHRIAMAFSILLTYCNGTAALTGCKAVNKSYPEFFEDYKRLGGIINVI